MSLREPKLQSASAPVIIATSGPPEAEAGGLLTIDLGALEANWRGLSRKVAPAEAAAVVKADGYGCGIEPVTITLAKAGCRTFFVAHLLEARRVRRLAPEASIYVLNGLAPNAAQGYAEAYARPVIGSLIELAEWDAFVSTSNWRGGMALHVDTGMNRLGFSTEEVAALATRTQLENHGITLLMSHFACADTPEHPLNDQQVRAFRQVRSLFRGIPSSLANSSGIFLGPSAYGDIVRPGMALYGANPTPGKANPMRTVVDLKVRVLQMRTVARKETIGYGSAWTAKRASRIAVISACYGDGIFRHLGGIDSNRGMALVAGKRCPFVGRISMDLLAIDVTELADNAVRRGDFVTLIGPGLELEDVAAHAGTISYEILTSLGRRYHRIYRG
jgi:alanine racemase